MKTTDIVVITAYGALYCVYEIAMKPLTALTAFDRTIRNHHHRRIVRAIGQFVRSFACEHFVGWNDDQQIPTYV